MHIDGDGVLVVRVPKGFSKKQVDAAVVSAKDWYVGQYGVGLPDSDSELRQVADKLVEMYFPDIKVGSIRWTARILRSR